MATPQFILDLRRHIGHAPLWLAGSSAVVVRDGLRRPQVLLVQRADDGQWTPVCGIIEPGERPDEAILREIHEETGVVAEVVRLVRVNVAAPRHLSQWRSVPVPRPRLLVSVGER
ncbi:hydrolase, NUDIX family [Cutibacterium acnes J139]|nr:hydrolase, NUDIX family [Cutibacterium acnes J139]